MPSFLDELEKAELHLHLEGSADLDVLCELAPELTRGEISAACRFHDFSGFIETYKFVVQRLRTPEHYALLARRLFESLQQQNVKHAEINLSVGVILWKEQEVASVFDSVSREAARSAVDVVWIFDAVRQFGPGDAMRVAELAAERVNCRVVGFGIGGNESGADAASFAPVFHFARRKGLHLVPHAGETTDAQSVWDALNLGAERIGHGIRAAEDPALLRHLSDYRIPLEICLTSNIRTGAVRRWAEHPIRRIFEAGVPVTLNTDDPGLFETTLVREYETAAQHFGFSDAELSLIAENAFRYAFHGPSAPLEAQLSCYPTNRT